ncbi:trehalase family glycosidase [Frigidibacter sp. RF13]|uniref:amylo-alpha-1,6-glucosidase n=1 Tax=Frigidibacter sp. RF13 TaxID=2997340 RepID=UPI00227086D0|nr:trehalase family glycosidase [Frigidibacter sp. RF13]MCY1128108.1 trehalase family glycosidase [Frigidibacter sp. RF13]
MLFDFAHVPFSRRGRFLTLSTMEGAVWLRSVKGGDLKPSLGRLCRVSFIGPDGKGREVAWTLAPERLVAEAAEGRVEFCIGDGERLHLRGKGLGVAFDLTGSRYDYAYRTPQGDHCLVAAAESTRLLPRVTKGAVTVTGDWRRDRADNVAMIFSGDAGFEGAIDLFPALPPPPASVGFDAVLAETGSDFASWLARTPAGGTQEARRLAAYLLWANTVPAEGALTRPAIYMSKNDMINIWSWDNAFSALGVAAMDEGLAFDQFGAIFDHQHPSGLLPDFVNDRDVSFAFTKPPVHGWAVLRLIERHPDWLTEDRRQALVGWFSAQVGYWLTHARKGASSLPVYFHGNDSGWDNATFFAEGGPVITPDLPTFLILACDCLASLDRERSAAWQAEAGQLYSQLIANLWTGETFGTRLAADPARLRTDQSLIGFMPLLLGPRLPREMAAKLIGRLKAGGWISDWGPATESTASPLYEADGYWRGPIWAPTTMLLWDGLMRQGEVTLARDIARRFCRMCEKSGMAENFDALSGTGLRDRAFAWTSAVYLWLAASLEEGGETSGGRP